jgi:hypothetical protein
MMEIILFNFISYLMSNSLEFSIVVEKKEVEFNPKLPDEISANFGDAILLNVHGYSFESAKLTDDKHFIFEAGFGRDNISSQLKIPLLGIKNIIRNNDLVFINVAQSREKRSSEIYKFLQNIPDEVESSMKALLMHPENRKIFESSNRK